MAGFSGQQFKRLPVTGFPEQREGVFYLYFTVKQAFKDKIYIISK